MQISITFNPQRARYEGFVNGRMVSRSTHKNYVEEKIKSMGYIITNATSSSSESTKKQFSITQRFEFVEKMVEMIAGKKIVSAIITGQGGLGKTYTVVKSLNDAGLEDVSDLASFEVGSRVQGSKSFRVIKGYSTAKGLYRTLYEGNGSTLVFDDCDSVLKDPVALNLLKGALDSYSDRYISWNADLRDDDLPRSFKFTGSIIFISNMDLSRVDQAIKTRAMCVDVSMSESQKIERMETIIKSEEFMEDYDPQYKQDALDFIKEILTQISCLSLRSLISVIKIRAEGGNWKDLAQYVLTQGD